MDESITLLFHRNECDSIQYLSLSIDTFAMDKSITLTFHCLYIIDDVVFVCSTKNKAFFVGFFFF